MSDEVEVKVGADCGECGDTGWVPDYDSPVRYTGELPTQPGVEKIGEKWFWCKPCRWCPAGRTVLNG